MKFKSEAQMIFVAAVFQERGSLSEGRVRIRPRSKICSSLKETFGGWIYKSHSWQCWEVTGERAFQFLWAVKKYLTDRKVRKEVKKYLKRW